VDNPTSYLILILVLLFAFICLGALLGSFFTINTAERGVVERFNKFSRIAGPGLSIKLPYAETVHRVDMRVQELPFKIETKTKGEDMVVGDW
jgi:regulator of protease activity HflC (stomatin/prohibitin superfamily)